MIDKKRWALAGSLLWGGAVLLLGLLATGLGYGLKMVEVLGSVYLGYSATWFGTFIGTVWALVDMFVGIYILIWLYEKIVKWTA
ncbi:hypothetical protein HN681_00280 [archaeon]|nr:hypothetical protein [archaeon]MBT3731278.1 hypothetical protein [archaeon]MBT4669931.1 hypothetical protein [archaeon]MBT5029756.1 hypothetical protein [archaeon]MBT5287495.1 hypothetical protein [archaeon]